MSLSDEGRILRCIAKHLDDRADLMNFVRRCNKRIRETFEMEGCGHTDGPFWRRRVFPHFSCCVRCRPHVPGVYSLDEIQAIHKARLPPEQNVGPYYPQSGVYPYDGAPEGVYYYPKHVIDDNVQKDLRLHARTTQKPATALKQRGMEAFLKKPRPN